MAKDEKRLSQPVPDPVQWHEGMLLSPQHLQQAWLHGEAQLAYHLRRLSPFHYGVTRLEIDRAQLASGRFQIIGLEAVLPDGLLVWSDGFAAELDFNLAAVKDKLRMPQRLHLVVPEYHPGAAKPRDNLARWGSYHSNAVDENTGQQELSVPRLRPLPRLLLADDVPPHHTHLPIAEVEFRNQGFQLTPYQAPTPALEPDDALSRECRDLVAKLREKATYVAESQGHEVNRGEARFTVMCLVAGLPALETLLRLPQVHPFELYMALQNVAGHTAVLRPAMTPPLTEPYDHDNPRGCIGALLSQLDGVVNLVSQAFSALPFQATADGFKLRIEENWLTGRGLVVGLRLKGGQGTDEVSAWIDSALIVPDGQVEELLSYRLRGAMRAALPPEEASGFATSRDMVLFRIAEDEYVKAGEMLLIVNPLDRTAKSRPGEILLFIPTAADEA